MGNEDFDEHTLAEKLSKLNSSQQSIELLSRWCVSFRKKAKQIVETWDKSFKSAQWDRRVAFLYLANDILQNSRRKGSEFVNEFWKVLPDTLKNAHENGGDSGKKVAARLVKIWEERKVFGSRGQNMKDLLGKDSLLPDSSLKSLNPIKLVKKDANSIRIKLSVGAMPEKIVSAFQLVHDENINEATAIDKCEEAISHVVELEKDIGNNSDLGGQQCSELIDKIKDLEDILGQSIIQLENAETTRFVLVSHLKDALADQEAELELVRNKIQVAHRGNEQTANLRQRLKSTYLPASPASLQQIETKKAVEPNMHTTQLKNTPLSPSNLLVPTASPKVNAEDSNKAAAAAVAAKLTASTSSAQMLTSILSSLVAEEVASMSSGLQPPGFSTLPYAPPEKRPRLDNNPEASNSYFVNAQPAVTSMPLGPSLGVQSASQANQIQAPFLPPPPPPPPVGNTPPSQSVQSSGMMMGMMPYAYGAGNLLPPSLPGQIAQRPAAQIQLSQLQIQQLQGPQSMHQQQQQQPASGGYYRPPGIGFYGQGHQASTPPLPRQ